MDETRKIDKRENLKVVTDNSMISAPDLTKLSLNARKLMYIAISQCKISDTEFYEYETTPTELAEMWGIKRSNVYQICDQITDELMKIVINIDPVEGKKFKKRHLFELCDYNDDSVLKFKLHKDMADLLLGLKKDFSKPLVWDFMKMRSTFSMALWHLFQKEMHSFKPMMTAPIEFELSLEELRSVTGTQNTFKQISEFKARVLDKALDEIRENCWTDITYINLKRGRTVVGFRFTAKNLMGNVNVEKLTYREQKLIRKAMLTKKKADGDISQKEYEELKQLNAEFFQISMEDYLNGYNQEG